MTSESRGSAHWFVRVIRGGFYRARFVLVVCIGKASELVDVLIDRRLGVDTGGYVAAAALGVGYAHVHGFEPSPWRTPRSILPADAVAVDDVFLDIGAGKGRIVIAAAPIADDVTVIYAYGPFEGRLLQCFAEQILASLDRRPRRIRVVARAPRLMEEVLLGSGRARVVRRTQGLVQSGEWGLPELALFELN